MSLLPLQVAWQTTAAKWGALVWLDSVMQQSSLAGQSAGVAQVTSPRPHEPGAPQLSPPGVEPSWQHDWPAAQVIPLQTSVTSEPMPPAEPLEPAAPPVAAPVLLLAGPAAPDDAVDPAVAAPP
jgi:hypothetical protein